MSLEKCDLSALKLNRNHLLALHSLQREKLLSRAELAGMCGVSAPAMTGIARDLISKSLITEAGKSGNTRGQPATNLTLNPDGVFSIGVFIERDAISINLINFIGEILTKFRVEGNYQDPRSTMPILFESLDRLLDESLVDQSRIAGIGVAVTGNFVIDGKTVVPPPDMELWTELDLATLFIARYPFSVIIENDASVAALGELLTGQGTTHKSFFYIYMGNGLGGGYILNGRLIRGAHGNASELGHMLPDPMIRPTLRNLAQKLEVPLGSISSSDIETLFRAKNEQFFDWLDRAIKNLQGPVNAISILLDPGAIIIGGRFPPEVTQYVTDKISTPFYGARWANVPRPQILAAKNLGRNAAVYGAATLPIHKFLERKHR